MPVPTINILKDNCGRLGLPFHDDETHESSINQIYRPLNSQVLGKNDGKRIRKFTFSSDFHLNNMSSTQEAAIVANDLEPSRRKSKINAQSCPNHEDEAHLKLDLNPSFQANF